MSVVSGCSGGKITFATIAARSSGGLWKQAGPEVNELPAREEARAHQGDARPGPLVRPGSLAAFFLPSQAEPVLRSD
jgi:hypothetical protein